jgi:hypothetical protein
MTSPTVGEIMEPPYKIDYAARGSAGSKGRSRAVFFTIALVVVFGAPNVIGHFEHGGEWGPWAGGAFFVLLALAFVAEYALFKRPGRRSAHDSRGLASHTDERRDSPSAPPRRSERSVRRNS